MKSLPLRFAAVVFVFIALGAAAHAAGSKKDSDQPDKKAPPSKTEKVPVLPDPVAVVEGVKIKRAELEKEFNTELSASGKTAPALTEEQKQQGYRTVLDNMIIDRLLRKRSSDVKVTDEEVDRQIQQIKSGFPSEDKMNEALKKNDLTLDKLKKKIRLDLKPKQWIESQIAGKTEVSDTDAQAFYDQHPESFKAPEMVRASHILIQVPQDAKPEAVAEKKKAIDAVAARIAKGEDFNKVAGEVSEDPSAKQNGGDLNFFSHDQMLPEFSEAAFKLEKGKVSDPVKTQYGFHLIKVTDKKETHVVPFAEAKEKIIAFLKNQKKREAVNNLIVSVRQKADVKVNLPPLEKPAAP